MAKSIAGYVGQDFYTPALFQPCGLPDEASRLARRSLLESETTGRSLEFQTTGRSLAPLPTPATHLSSDLAVTLDQVRRCSAVDDEQLAGHITGSWESEEGDDVGHLFGPAHPLHGNSGV